MEIIWDGVQYFLVKQTGLQSEDAFLEQEGLNDVEWEGVLLPMQFKQIRQTKSR